MQTTARRRRLAPVILLACASLGACSSGGKKTESDKTASTDKGATAKTAEEVVKTPPPPKLLPVRELPADSGEHQGNAIHGSTLGGDDSEDARGIGLAANGDLLLCGYFKGSGIFGIEFDDPDAAAYAARLKPDTGEVVWATHLGGEGEESAEAIAGGPDGTVVVAGSMSGSMSVGDGTLKATGADDIFIAKFAEDGRRLWAKQLGGHDVDAAEALAIDSEGNIFMTGVFRGTSTFGEQEIESEGRADIFLAKLAPSGEFLWLKSYGDVGEDYGRDLAFDSAGNVVLLAEISAQVSFGGEMLTTAGNRDIAIAKFDKDGTHLWSKSFGNNFDDVAMSVSVDPSDNILFTGSFEGELSFGGDTHEATRRSDMYVAKFDPNGSFHWSKAFGGKDKDWGNSIATDEFGNAFVTGWFWYEIDFGGQKLKSNGDDDIFLTKFAPNGEVLWAKSFGSKRLDKGKGVVATKEGVITVGAYHDGIDLGTGVLTPTPSRDKRLQKGDLYLGVFGR